METALVIANVVLVLVTGWYAVLTYWISRASARAATASEKSAEAAAQAADASRWSAAVAYASLIVNFDVGPAYSYITVEEVPALDEHERRFNLGVRLRVDNANVFIHCVTLRDYFRLEEAGPVIWKLESDGVREVPLRFGVGREPPALFAAGEEADFWTRDAWVPMDYVSTVAVRVEYSIDGGTETRERRVLWEGQQGKDFRFWGSQSMLERRSFDTSLPMSTYRMD